jgi:hypothetical protein
VNAKKKPQKYKKILDMKDNYTPETLCAGLPGNLTSVGVTLDSSLCQVLGLCEST